MSELETAGATMVVGQRQGRKGVAKKQWRPRETCRFDFKAQDNSDMFETYLTTARTSPVVVPGCEGKIGTVSSRSPDEATGAHNAMTNPTLAVRVH